MLFLAIFTIVIVGLSAESTLFHRNCRDDNDCQFKHSGMTPVFLQCHLGKCECKNVRNKPVDIPWYPVRIVKNECVVSYNAPCGFSDGLQLACDSGKSCIYNRCRSGQRKSGIDNWCDEDFDCQIGLKCKVKKNSFPIDKHCQ